jgi:protease IV
MIWPFKPRPKKQIARIEITGAIGPGTRKRVLEAIKTIEEKGYKALLLRIDSPGGTVADSNEIYQALVKLQEKVTIVASFGNISASGGVYIGVGAPHIVANPGSLTGSIGVILRGNNIERLLEKVGVSFKVIKSGQFKDILAFDRELTEDERRLLQELIDISYGQFVQVVAQGRKLDPERVRSFADGRIFTGQQALEYGLVDRLGTEEDARRWLAELADLDPEKVQTVSLEEKKPLLSKLVGSRAQAAPGLAGALAQVPGMAATAAWLEFELETSGQPLWLYRP